MKLINTLNLMGGGKTLLAAGFTAIGGDLA